jgi:hypothetical protein
MEKRVNSGSHTFLQTHGDQRGLILCAGKASEQIELLELDKSGIKVADT